MTITTYGIQSNCWAWHTWSLVLPTVSPMPRAAPVSTTQSLRGREPTWQTMLVSELILPYTTQHIGDFPIALVLLNSNYPADFWCLACLAGALLGRVKLARYYQADHTTVTFAASVVRNLSCRGFIADASIRTFLENTVFRHRMDIECLSARLSVWSQAQKCFQFGTS